MISPRGQWWVGSLYKSAAYPSKLLLWWESQSSLRRSRQINDIDIALIENALKGFSNEWTAVVNENKAIANEYINDKTNIGKWEKLRVLLIKKP